MTDFLIKTSTTTKVGDLELIGEKACFLCIFFFFFFLAKTELETIRRVSWNFFKHFPELSVKYSGFVIESHQVNY